MSKFLDNIEKAIPDKEIAKIATKVYKRILKTSNIEIDPFDKQLRLILKNRLSNRPNHKYLQWRLEKKLEGNDLDHIVKKRNDLLLAEREHSEHIYDEYKDYTDNFINALEELFDYIEELQRNGT